MNAIYNFYAQLNEREKDDISDSKRIGYLVYLPIDVATIAATNTKS